MKHPLALILLTLIITLSAGCIDTTENPQTDQIIGTWKYTDSFETSYLTFNNGGTGTLETNAKTTPTTWKNHQENTYYLNELYYVTFNEDGTMTDRAGYTYALENRAQKIGGTWTETPKDIFYNTLIFNEDGTGYLTLYGEDEQGKERLTHSEILWEYYGENQITYQYCLRYLYDQNGDFETPANKNFELIDGAWTTTVNGETLTYRFFDNGLAVRTIDDGEITTELWMQWENNPEGTGGYGTYATTSIIHIIDDETLIDGWDQIYSKLS